MARDLQDLLSFTKQVKNSLGMGKIRIEWLTKPGKGSAIISTQTIRIPLPETLENAGVDKEEAEARTKAAIAEELCHIHTRQDHTPELCGCYNKSISDFMTQHERNLVIGKTLRLQEACDKRTPSNIPVSTPETSDGSITQELEEQV